MPIQEQHFLILRDSLSKYLLKYRIYSNKRRGAYLIFRFSCAALIRGRRLLEGGAY